MLLPPQAGQVAGEQATDLLSDEQTPKREVSLPGALAPLEARHVASARQDPIQRTLLLLRRRGAPAQRTKRVRVGELGTHRCIGSNAFLHAAAPVGWAAGTMPLMPRFFTEFEADSIACRRLSCCACAACRRFASSTYC